MFKVTTHAIERRLQYEGASTREWRYIVQNRRAEMVSAMLDELRTARRLSSQAKTVLSDPYRYAHRGLDQGDRILLVNHHGTRITRGDTGFLYLASPSVCYVVHLSGNVVTTICPNDVQLKRVREIDGPFEIPIHPPRITRILEDARVELLLLKDAIRTHVIAANRGSVPGMWDGRLQIPRWLWRKPDASWKILLADANGDGNELADHVTAWIAAMPSDDPPPDRILVEGNSTLAFVNVLQGLRERLRETHVIRLPDLTNAPESIRWSRIIACCIPTSGKVLMVVCPKTAELLFGMVERAYPSGSFGSRRLVPGQVFHLAAVRTDEDKTLLRITCGKAVQSLLTP